MMTKSGLQVWQLARWTLSVGTFFVAWEVIGRMNVLLTVKPFNAVMQQLWVSLTVGDLLEAAGGTLKLAAVGYVVSIAIGLPLGIITGLSRAVANVVDPIIDILWSVPMYMFIPLLALYFGLGFQGKLVLVVMFCFVLVTVNTAAGLRRVPKGLVDMGVVFGVTGIKSIAQVMLPSARPYIIHSLSITLGRAVEAAVGADLLLGIANLGGFLVDAGAKFQLEALLAGTFFIAVLAAGVVGLGRLLEWRLQYRKGFLSRLY